MREYPRSNPPGPPVKKMRMLNSNASELNILNIKLLDALLNAELRSDVDLTMLYTMRTDGQCNNTENLIPEWDVVLNRIAVEHGAVQSQFQQLFSIQRRQDAYVFNHMGGFFNFRNVIGSDDEPAWLRAPGLPVLIMNEAIKHFGCIEIVDSAYAKAPRIRGGISIEEIPIRMHKFLTSCEAFEDSSYYRKFGFKHVHHNGWELMNSEMDKMRNTFRDGYNAFEDEIRETTEEKYSLLDLSNVRKRLNFGNASEVSH